MHKQVIAVLLPSLSHTTYPPFRSRPPKSAKKPSLSARAGGGGVGEVARFAVQLDLALESVRIVDFCDTLSKFEDFKKYSGPRIS